MKKISEKQLSSTHGGVNCFLVSAAYGCALMALTVTGNWWAFGGATASAGATGCMN